MRCYICDKALTEPTFNRDTKTFEPCQECLDVIADAVGAFTDRPSVAEDEHGLTHEPLPTEYQYYLSGLEDYL